MIIVYSPMVLGIFKFLFIFLFFNFFFFIFIILKYGWQIIVWHWQVDVRISFRPSMAGRHCTVLLIRNNLTVVDTVLLYGNGGQGMLKFANRSVYYRSYYFFFYFFFFWIWEANILASNDILWNLVWKRWMGTLV